MSGETTEQVEAADDAFNAGFTGETKVTGTPPETTPETTAQTPEATPEPEPEFIQITKPQFEEIQQRLAQIDEIRGESKRGLEKAFGHIGSLKQSLTAHPGSFEISAEDLVDVEKEYGPDLANALKGTLQKVLGKQRPAQEESAKPAAETPAVPDVISKTRSEMIDSRLDEIVNGDWHKEVASPEFTAWIRAQPADVTALSASDNLRDASRLLRLFVESKKPVPAPAPSPQKSDQRQRVLQAAVNPRSKAVTPPTSASKDPFDEGFEAVRR